MYGLKPVFDFVDMDYTKQVKSIKESLYVVFNRAREKFVVKDVDLHGTSYIVMVVQNPDGSFRPFDERTLEGLRKSVQRGPDVRRILGELQAIENARTNLIDKEAEDIEYGMLHDFKWAGKDVVPSTAWRDRTDVPDHIKKTRREKQVTSG